MLKSALKAFDRSKSWENPTAEKINVKVNNSFFIINI